MKLKIEKHKEKKINEIKTWFFVKIKKIHKLLGKLAKEKREYTNYPYQE